MKKETFTCKKEREIVVCYTRNDKFHKVSKLLLLVIRICREKGDLQICLSNCGQTLLIFMGAKSVSLFIKHKLSATIGFDSLL